MKLENQDLRNMNRVLRHRLRNLVSGIQTSTSLLSQELKERLTPGEMEYFPLIIDVCERINEITDRFNLLFDDLPCGGERDVVSVVRDAVAALHGRIPTARVRVGIDDSAMQARISADHLVRIALEETLANAAQAAPGKEIMLDAGIGEEGLLLEVRDQGEGVTAEQERLMFRPFHTTREQQLGLGLAVTLRAVERMGGAVTAFQPESAGLCVRMTLPRSDVPDETADGSWPVYGSRATAGIPT